MNKSQAEENIQLIRDVMERSARYTHFSGLSGVLSGILALIGCWVTCWIDDSYPSAHQQNTLYIITWVSVLVIAIVEDLVLAQRNARRNGTSIWVPATYQLMKAVFPGIFAAFVISISALQNNSIEMIPGIWALGYGAALCAAGMFTVKEIWVYGIIQIITGAIGLLALGQSANSFYLLAVSFGIYQILFGLWMTRKYRK